MYTNIREIYGDFKSFIGKEVQIGGWVRTLRDNKNFGFIEINDGSFFKGVQVVFHNDLENFIEITKLGVGTSLTIVGEVVESQGAKQDFEIKALKIVVEGTSPSDYPLQKKRHTLEYLRTIAHLRPRTNTFMAVFRIRSLASYAVHKFFNERDYVYVHTPIITASDCEGAGEMFNVTTLEHNNMPKDEDGNINYKEDFFGKTAYLTVSGQLSAETFAMAFKNVYTFGPTFRAENSNTPRHAAEFWMIEPEIAFADLNDDMNIAEELIKFVIDYVLEHGKEEIDFFNSFVDKGLKERLTSIVNANFCRVTYTDAIDILLKAKKEFEYPVSWGMDLQTEHERYLSEEHFKKPVFVTDYPKDIKAFYMRMNDDNKTVAAMDLLAPQIGELIGGSQREERIEVLESRIEELGLNKEDYGWYLDLRKFGGVKHAGFGIGFERLVMYLTGMANIRDVIPYPRTSKNAEF
ncbi:MAG: asparagine--tRNA ligase [Lachnospirales bacterium]